MRACRTCLSKHDLCPLFGESEFTSDQLYKTTGVMIAPDDGLPQTACKSCIKSIIKSLHLRELSSKADEFLKTITRHEVVKEEQNIKVTIENILGLFPEESNQNSHHLIQSHEQIDDMNDLNENDDLTLGDDVKPSINKDNTYLSNNKEIYETEFVNIQTKTEYIEDSKTESRNCLTLSKDAQIMLYPSKDGSNNDVTKTKESIGSTHLTTVVLCQSMKMAQLQKISKETNMKYSIKCSADIMGQCNSEICRMILKNKEKGSVNSFGQTAEASGAIANVSGQANVSDKPANMTCPSSYLFGQTAKIYVQTANSTDRRAKTSGQIGGIENDYISKKELNELFKDCYKFGKKTYVLDNTSDLCSTNKTTKSLKTHQQFDDYNNSKNGKRKSATRFKNSSSNARKLSKKDEIDSENDYDSLFASLMSNLKKKLAKCTPKDSQENDVIKQKSNIMKPFKMDLTRRKYFRERNNKLMSLAVTPYKEGGPIECRVCHDVVQKKHSFRSHALKHFDKQHVCKFAGCGKKFVHRGQLSRHEQCLHGVEKKFSCGQCGFRAADRLTMQNHIRAEHTGEKPYECNECGAKFRMRNNIIQHIKQVHFKPHKNIQCEYCPSLFQCRRDLWMHQDKAHFYTYSYYCYLCTNTYRSGCSARKHLLKVHGVPKNQQLKLRRDKIRKADAPISSNVKPIISNTPR